MRLVAAIIAARLIQASVAVPADVLEQRQWLSYDNIDPNATPGARSLLKFLQDKDNIGKTPAIQGNDFMDYSPSRVEHGTSSQEVEHALSFDAQGGINAFVWHWNAPTCLYDTTEEPWHSGFYTAATCFDVQEALGEGGGGSNYQLLLRDIDAIADQVKRLSDSNIPFLWRPLHEPEGGWFWWGAKGAEAFKQLWNLIYDRLTGYHGLHNMVWVCNTEAGDWYPGNDKCDIVTTDIYAAVGDHSAQKSHWDTSQTSDGALWAYWMTWGGEFVEDGNHNPKDFLSSVYNDGMAANADELGDWKST